MPKVHLGVKDFLNLQSLKFNRKDEENSEQNFDEMDRQVYTAF
jgi:hypothetical protein